MSAPDPPRWANLTGGRNQLVALLLLLLLGSLASAAASWDLAKQEDLNQLISCNQLARSDTDGRNYCMALVDCLERNLAQRRAIQLLHALYQARTGQDGGKLLRAPEKRRQETLARTSRMILDPALESMASRSQSEALSSFLMNGVHSESGEPGEQETVAATSSAESSQSSHSAAPADGKSMYLESVDGDSLGNRWQPMRGKRAAYLLEMGLKNQSS